MGILASGGFGADFTQNSLLAQYRPDLMHLPTTNGEHCTGDGIKMGEAIGGKTIDLEWVQVHPMFCHLGMVASYLHLVLALALQKQCNVAHAFPPTLTKVPACPSQALPQTDKISSLDVPPM